MYKILMKTGRYDVSVVSFLLKALGKPNYDSKYGLEYVCSTEVDGCKVLVTSDSRRLHLIENEHGIPAGLYRPIMDKKEGMLYLEPVTDTSKSFPDCAPIIERAMHTDGETHVSFSKDSSCFSGALASFFRAYPGTINIDMLKDLGEDSYDAWFYADSTQHGPCFFINCTKIAVLMPLRF